MVIIMVIVSDDECWCQCGERNGEHSEGDKDGGDIQWCDNTGNKWCMGLLWSCHGESDDGEMNRNCDRIIVHFDNIGNGDLTGGGDI